MPEWAWKMALNAETKKNSDSKYMNEYEKRLWTPNGNNGYGCGYETTTLNIELRMNNSSERQMEIMALSAKTKATAPNAELKQRPWMASGKRTMALNAKTKQRLWTPNEKCDSIGYQNETTALNAKLEKRLWTPNGTMALNAKRKTSNGSKLQNEDVWLLWTLKWRCMMALNAKWKRIMALNTKLKQRPWTPNGEMSSLFPKRTAKWEFVLISEILTRAILRMIFLSHTSTC